MKMLYIIEADETTKATIQRAVRTIQNNPPEMTPIVQDEEGRTTPIHVVAEFYDNQLRTEFPQLMPWSQLDQETRTGIALIMAGYIPWQFPEHYQMDLDDTYADVTNTHPKTLGQEETDPRTPTPEPHSSNASSQ